MSEPPITVDIRIPFETANGFTGQDVHLNTGHSFKSFDMNDYGSGVLTKGDWVSVVDGSSTDAKGTDLIEGQIVSLRENAVWVHNPQTKEMVFAYPHADQIRKTPSPKTI